MKNNELATKLEEIVGGVPAKNAIEAIDHLIQQVAMGSAKRAKAIIEKIQELESALKAEEELYLSSMNRLPGDTVIDRPESFTRAPMLWHVEGITVGDIMSLVSPDQVVVLTVSENVDDNIYDDYTIRKSYHNSKVSRIDSNSHRNTSIILIHCEPHA